jgi:hypothetical protein
MKWFKHYSDAYLNLKLHQVVVEYGLFGYGLYWMCLELAAQQGVNYRIKRSKGWISMLSFLTQEKEDRLAKILSYFATHNLIEEKAFNDGDLYIPKMLEYADEYTEKVRRKSRQGRESVGLDKIRLEEKRRDKNKDRPGGLFDENLKPLPNPHVGPLIDFFVKAVKFIRNIEPPVLNGGKVGKLLKTRLEVDNIGPDRIERMVIWFLTRKHRYQDTNKEWQNDFKYSPDFAVMLSDAFFSQMLSDEQNALTFLKDNAEWIGKLYSRPTPIRIHGFKPVVVSPALKAQLKSNGPKTA